MASPKQQKPVSKKSRSRRPQKKKSRGTMKRWIAILSLLGLLVFTLSAVGYVIFFRTVLA